MGCFSCMKYLYIFLNFIFLIFGIAGLAFIVWIMLDPTIPLRFTQEPNDFMSSSCIYIVVAVLLIIISIMGIYSVCKEVRWALILSFSVLLIIVVVEVASGVWIFMNREDLDAFTQASVKKTVQDSYDKDDSLKQMFDTIQSKMHCCGSDRPLDWARGKEINLGITSASSPYDIPESCCIEGITKQQCYAATHNLNIGTKLDFTKIYEIGCYRLIKDKIIDSFCIILAVCGAILAVQLLGLILGLILAFSMNNSNRYKA